MRHGVQTQWIVSGSIWVSGLGFIAALAGRIRGFAGGACLRFAIPSGRLLPGWPFTSLEQKDLAEELLLSSLILPGN